MYKILAKIIKKSHTVLPRRSFRVSYLQTLALLIKKKFNIIQ